MDYVLKHDNEFDRLEKQSLLPNYNFKTELSGLKVNKGDFVLDACCGTGVVTRYLAELYPKSQFLGCDIGEMNLNKAQSKVDDMALENISFIKEDVTRLSFKSNTFDHIVCRYAIQHLPKEKRELGISELYRVLKPGGSLYLIDFDGTLYNIFPTTEYMTECFDSLKKQNTIDLHIGRKIPSFATKVGFQDVQFRIESLSFMENGLEEEIKQMEMRFQNAREFLINSLGGELEFKRFEKDFFNALTTKGATYFYNKFIVVCRK